MPLPPNAEWARLWARNADCWASHRSTAPKWGWDYSISLAEAARSGQSCAFSRSESMPTKTGQPARSHLKLHPGIGARLLAQVGPYHSLIEIRRDSVSPWFG